MLSTTKKKETDVSPPTGVHLISKLGQSLQSYFVLYRQFTFTEAAEECVFNLVALLVFNRVALLVFNLVALLVFNLISLLVFNLVALLVFNLVALLVFNLVALLVLISYLC